MAIQEQNIVFVESQIMDDVPEGGGAATGKEVVDGQMNNVFEDISDLDRAYGRLNLRKLALAVRSLDTDLYGGAKTVITGLPTDPALGYALFTTNDPFDTRADAANRVEAYLYKGPLWPGALNENHIEGMRAISVIQRVGTALPPVGKTLCLVQNEGLSNEQEQYIRIIQVDTVEATFTDSAGDFTRWIVTMSLSDELRYDFAGHTVNRTDTYTYTGKTRLRDTTVADATRFYSSTRVAEAALATELKIRATSMFAQLVPSAQTETPLISQPMSSQKIPMLASRASTLSATVTGAAFANSGKFALDTGAYPGTISVVLGAYTLTDDGVGGAKIGGATVGAWDYATGVCQFNSSGVTSASGTATVTYTPATAVAQQAHTLTRPVTVENRRLNWIETLSPIPTPGTFELSYMAGGNWYVLSGTGTGTVVGTDPTFGAGTINYVTGAVAVTLGALPDVGSQIMLTWASPVHTSIRVGDSAIDTTLVVEHALGETLLPQSLTVTWLAGGVTKTASGASSGAISGDCTGYVAGGTGDLWLEFTTPPDAGTKIGLDYQRGMAASQSFADVAEIEGLAALDLGVAVTPGSVTATWTTVSTVRRDSWRWVLVWYKNGEAWAYRRVRVSVLTPTPGAARVYENSATDDGAGHIGTASGTVNYTTGEIVLPVVGIVAQRAWDPITRAWVAVGVDGTAFMSGVVDVVYLPASETPSATSVEIDVPPLRVDVVPRLLDEALVPGSLRFTWNGQTYVDRNGTLYRAVSPTTGAGTVAGTVDYQSGVCALSDYVGGSGAVVVTALLTRFGDFTAIEASFCTALAPIKSEALSLVAVTEDGEQITGVADADGVIAGTWMRGTFNYEFGTAFVEFGQLDGATWESRAVDPSTLRYNAVAYSYLPLDADILGIDPVRLPPDGRVPIYRAGDVIVILHPLTNAPATPALNGGTGNYELACGRTRLAWVRITDTNGAAVTDGYTLDRATGLLSWDDISGLATPLTVKHTVADLRMITDAQISGWLTLARSLSHDFPADESIIAACLIHGDRRARVSALWDQSSWDGVWRDSISGSAATATLNTIDYPVTVTNEGADTDRWVFRCTSSSSNTWELISEHRGLVWTGTYPPYVSGTPVDVAPINPRTRDENGQNGVPYLVIPQRANGGGWATGNAVLITTVGAIADFWMARSIQQSDEPAGDGADGCEIYALGNIDRP